MYDSRSGARCYGTPMTRRWKGLAPLHQKAPILDIYNTIRESNSPAPGRPQYKARHLAGVTGLAPHLPHSQIFRMLQYHAFTASWSVCYRPPGSRLVKGREGGSLSLVPPPREEGRQGFLPGTLSLDAWVCSLCERGQRGLSLEPWGGLRRRRHPHSSAAVLDDLQCNQKTQGPPRTLCESFVCLSRLRGRPALISPSETGGRGGDPRCQGWPPSASGYLPWWPPVAPLRQWLGVLSRSAVGATRGKPRLSRAVCRSQQKGEPGALRGKGGSNGGVQEEAFPR
jgi:hypothetical protein